MAEEEDVEEANSVESDELKSRANSNANHDVEPDSLNPTTTSENHFSGQDSVRGLTLEEKIVSKLSALAPGRVRIVVLSRLVYRKGTDLLIPIISILCRRHPDVDFVIGGDGPHLVKLETLVEKQRLQGEFRMK
jgi:glycosyltransferase involved in cell wall biosynthesis